MTDAELAALLPPIPDDANKYTRGSVLVLAGSARYPGAAVLAAQAAARTGAGYVTLATPKSVSQVAQGHLLSIPVLAAPAQEGAFTSDAWEDIRAQVNHVDAIVLGPGLTVTPSTSAFVAAVLQGAAVPIVVDADALNAVAALYVTKGTECFVTPVILTPHAGELKRLYDATETNSVEELAHALNCIVVAKGPVTRIVSPEQSVSSQAGTAALAKAGTGDVLSGIIGSLLGQGAPPFDAALLGVELHGRAGRVAEQKLGRRSVCAEDLLDALPVVLRDWEK